MIRAEVDAIDEEKNEIATNECDCAGAKKYRRLQTESDIARENIDSLFAEKNPEAAALLKEAITPIQNGKIKSLSIQVTPKIKASIKKSTKDSLVVNRTYTQKEELDTE